MGQCCCGELQPCKVFQVGETFIAVDDYRGCDGCNLGPCAYLYFFDRKGAAEWLEDFPVTPVTPDEFGGNEGRGFPVFILDLDALVLAAREIDQEEDTEPFDQYSSLENLISDKGLRLLQKALRISQGQVRDAPPPGPDARS